MSIRVLGPLTVDGADIKGRRDRIVLAVLACRLGQPVPIDTVADAVWSDEPPPSAAKNLQGCVVRLRRLLGAGAIATTSLGYSLEVPPDDVDVWQFERLVTRARELLALSEPDRASYQLGEALALWRGRPFLDLESWPPAAPEVRRLVELRLEAEELRAQGELAAGRVGEVLAGCQTLVREAPLREQRWALLARAQYQSGQQAAALRTIHQLKAILSEQLGIDPSRDVMALEQAVLQQDPSLVVPEQMGEVLAACPWQGLRAYDVEDADWFFGREREVAACLEILRTQRLLALAGPSGSGKSSLLRAGVGSALRARGHRLVTLTPGARPMEAVSVLRGGDPQTVLLVDQAEEVFTLCSDEQERRTFLDSLVDEAERRTVVVALRADRLSDVALHSSFSRLLERGLYLVGGLDEDGLRATIETPARQAGLLVEPGLVDLLVAEVVRDPGALPLLSHALLETWQRREGRTLTTAGYRDSGGIQGAVAKSAEQLYAALDPDDRPHLRDVMLRLVIPDEEGDPVRAKVPRRLLDREEGRDELVERLVEARLVTSDQGVLAISHEALARAWPRLRSWLDDDIDGQRILHHLAATADGWDTLGRPDTELYRGVRLARALGWKDQHGASLNPVETDFLEASREAEEVAERSAAAHARRQTVLIRRLRLVLGGAVVLLVLALVAGGFAAVQSDRAGRNAAEARQAVVSADARRIGARAQLADDISLSLLLAIAGVRLDDSPETRTNLLAALAERPHLVRSAPAGGDYLEVMAVSPDGRWIAASDDSNRMHLYDASTNEVVRTYDGAQLPEGTASMLPAFSPDGRQLAVSTYAESTEPVRLLDTSTMQPAAKKLAALPGGEPVYGGDVQFSADGRYLAATVLTDTTGRGVVWDLRSPSKPPALVPVGPVDWGVALSPDGQTMYTPWPLTAYDVATGRPIWRRNDVTSYLVLDVNAAGTRLALEDRATDKDGLLVDAATGRTVARLRGHQQGIRDLRFSWDGSLVGTASHDGEVIVWNVRSGKPMARWDTFEQSWSIGFSPDGGLVYAGGDDAMLRTWDLAVDDTYLRRTARITDADGFAHADVAPDGGRVAYRWLDDKDKGWVRFVDTATGAATPPTPLPVYEGEWSPGVWHPDGETYVSHGCDEPCAEAGTLTVTDPTTGKALNERHVFDGEIYSLTYVDGDRSLLAGDSEGRTHIFDAETLRPRGDPLDVPSDCCATSLGDGSTALLYDDSDDGASERWRVIDLGNGDVLSDGDLDLRAYTSVASPDGSTVAVAGQTGELVTIDVSSGEQRQGSTGLASEVLWLRYSGDGARLVSGAADGGVSLWDARTLDLLGTVYPPNEGDAVPAGVQFIGDSHAVVIASYDGRVYTWETDPGRALDFACQMAGRNLTEEEWAEFLPEQAYRKVCPGLRN
ncbi:nSTAND1 domain-containing NTPase [Nocardioides astragali]|uniref:BTAD domain-containing putative transcriptional regulator n=1 Tax=Nocardioides astragali TaxID=1776736 RepID=A0ABW2N0E2_9ACTN|nr:BTAD domain-containing putative transcriptional regulator [Nocardioides astragali]